MKSSETSERSLRASIDDFVKFSHRIGFWKSEKRKVWYDAEEEGSRKDLGSFGNMVKFGEGYGHTGTWEIDYVIE